ncbi:MAG: hypothetical protein D3903_07930 [Candidatus Electrothrix sp. GM3_4]|nr:hypothetical protein [Candidatus Electrothrix sp. GM3_4]
MRQSISFGCTGNLVKRKNYSFISLLAFFFFFAFFPVKEAASGSEYIFSVTIDNPWNDPVGQYEEIRDALASHTVKPTVRVVFDEWMPAWEYREPVKNIKKAAFVMGEILDSYYVQNYSVQEYLDRTEEYLDKFKDIVDIWEIGNEVNGSWLGDTADVVDKIEGAYAAVVNAGGRTALNLYYNKSCFYDKPEHKMFTWVNANILNDDMKNGLDYVFFSYYEDDCEDVIHTQEEWQEVFDALHLIFPKSKLGFGEIGTKKVEKKAEYMQRYYSLDIKGDYYVGGYFWWYYKQDGVPKTTKFWSILNAILLERESRGSRLAGTCVVFVVIRFFKSLKIKREQCPQFFPVPRMCMIQASAYRRFKVFGLAILLRSKIFFKPP